MSNGGKLLRVRFLCSPICPQIGSETQTDSWSMWAETDYVWFQWINRTATRTTIQATPRLSTFSTVGHSVAFPMGKVLKSMHEKKGPVRL